MVRYKVVCSMLGSCERCDSRPIAGVLVAGEVLRGRKMTVHDVTWGLLQDINLSAEGFKSHEPVEYLGSFTRRSGKGGQNSVVRGNIMQDRGHWSEENFSARLLVSLHLPTTWYK